MNQPALDLPEGSDLSPLNIIRTETALSRFPFHRLAKKGLVQIEIKNQASALLWEVTYNSKYGQPGPLAYKLDTLIINRRIEEVGRPVPQIIKLGSLAQIASELGLNRDTNSVKVALLQNAFAAVNAKISYRTVDRTERTLEAAFTRYAVVFTGEKLPDGKTADAVCLVFHPIYADVLNAAVTRPLDYDYMKALPPAAQRFYEIVSYQIYGALFHQNERARLLYSEYCLLSTATRYLDFNHVKKQMYKIHKPHLESGYLAKVNFEQTTDSTGQPDWWMYYVPGPNASREYRKFTGNVRKSSGGKRGSSRDSRSSESMFLPFSEFTEAQETGGETPVEPTTVPEQKTSSKKQEKDPLTEALVSAGLNRPDAERFAREKPEECRRQLLYLPYKTDVQKPGGWLLRAIEGEFAPPDGYREAQAKAERERQKQQEAERRKAAEATKRAVEAAEAAKTTEDMARLETEAPEAFLAFTAYAMEQQRQADAKLVGMPPSIRAKMLKTWETPEKRRELFKTWQQMPEEQRLAFAHPENTQIEIAPIAEPPVSASSDEAKPLTEEDPDVIRSLISSALSEKNSK